MPSSCMRAVLYAKDLNTLSTFYQALFDAKVLHSDADHAALDLGGFKLFLHRLPVHLAKQVVITVPPQRREAAPLRLWFSVGSLESARSLAAAHGGCIDPGPPAWVVDSQSICTGHDPEGNVFQLLEE